MFSSVDDSNGWERNVWEYVSRSPLRSLWDLRGVPVKVVAKRVFTSTMDDNLFGRSAQLAYYFLFALFPTLISASSLLGLMAKSAKSIYVDLLNTIAGLIPPAAFGIVMDTFNQTTKASTPGKVTLGFLTALWSASVGISAIQDTLNSVYKVKETRSYWRARLEAMMLTVATSALFSVAMAALFGSDFGAVWSERHLRMGYVIGLLLRTMGWIMASALISLTFAAIYYWSPDVTNRRWRWFSPGGMIGLGGWILGSLALRLYLHFFDSYSVTYGSLGAVVILLTWFYLTGLMLLLGAEVNSEIEAAVTEQAMIKKQALEPGTDVPHAVSPLSRTA